MKVYQLYDDRPKDSALREEGLGHQAWILPKAQLLTCLGPPAGG